MQASWVDIALRSLGVSVLATILVMLVAVPTSYGLSRYHFRGRLLVSAVLMLPLVLPPTAVGLLLLVLLSDHGPLGCRCLSDILFSWRAAVLAAAVMSFPLALRTARLAFDGVDARLEAMAESLGYTWPARFFTVTLPLAQRGLAAATILAFLRGLGEYGATVMIAGNIPGQTQTLALAIEARQSAGHTQAALGYALLTVLLGVISLLVAEKLLSTGQTGRHLP